MLTRHETAPAWTIATAPASPTDPFASWTYSVKDHNQDAVHAGDGFLVVVDGATPINGHATLGPRTSRFAATLVHHLATLRPSPRCLY